MRLRFFAVFGICVMIYFMWADLQFLPDYLSPAYIYNRIFWQLLPILAMIGLSFFPGASKYIHLTTCSIFVWLSFSNYYFIYYSWMQYQFVFHYEATLIYTFLGFFVIGTNLRYAIIFIISSAIGFIVLTTLFPIYGERTLVNISFVLITQIICLIAAYYVKKIIIMAKHAHDELLALSQTDHLTQLLNRGAFKEQSDKLFKFSQRPPLSICVFMVDIDFFKDYNDGYGHQQGDKAIKIQAEILRNVFKRDTDLIARYGGEEFVIAVSNIEVEQARSLAQAILDEWTKRNLPHGKGKAESYVTCSVGFKHCIASTQKSIEDIVNKADQALYIAKKTGRGRYVQASDDVEA